MSAILLSLSFDQPSLQHVLDTLHDDELDGLGFGVIGFEPRLDASSGASCVVRRYNRHESEAAGLRPARVVGQPLFTSVAPCMNNYLVAQRFDDAAARGVALDATIDYVLTLRMRPTKVALRLLYDPQAAFAYVLVRRQPA